MVNEFAMIATFAAVAVARHWPERRDVGQPTERRQGDSATSSNLNGSGFGFEAVGLAKLSPEQLAALLSK